VGHARKGLRNSMASYASKISAMARSRLCRPLITRCSTRMRWLEPRDSGAFIMPSSPRNAHLSQRSIDSITARLKVRFNASRIGQQRSNLLQSVYTRGPWTLTIDKKRKNASETGESLTQNALSSPTCGHEAARTV